MRAKETFRMAKEMGYNIPFPLTFAELINKDYDPRGIKRLYVDGAHELAQAIVGRVEIAAIAVDDRGGQQ